MASIIERIDQLESEIAQYNQRLFSSTSANETKMWAGLLVKTKETINKLLDQQSVGSGGYDIALATSAAVHVTCRKIKGRSAKSESSGTLITIDGVFYVTTLMHCLYEWTTGTLRTEFKLTLHDGQILVPLAVQYFRSYCAKLQHEPVSEAALFHIEQAPGLESRAVRLHRDGDLPLASRLSGAGYRNGDLQLAVGLIVRVHREFVQETGQYEVQYFTDSPSSMGGLSGTGLLHAGQVCGILQGARHDTDDHADQIIKCKASELGTKWLSRVESLAEVRTLTRVVTATEVLRVHLEGYLDTLTLPNSDTSLLTSAPPTEPFAAGLIETSLARRIQHQSLLLPSIARPSAYKIDVPSESDDNDSASDDFE